MTPHHDHLKTRRTIGYFHIPDVASGQFDLLKAPLHHLTHLIAGFAEISQDGKVVWAPDASTLAVKARFPHLKLLLAVGGWTWSGRFSDAALTAESRKAFAESAVSVLKKYQFDGFDIDWEFPVIGGEPQNIRRPEDRQNFTLLLEELRRSFDAAEPDLERRLILTAAMGAGKNQVEALETNTFHKYVDWIHLMTYDFHGSWNDEPGHNSSLSRTEDSVRLHQDRGFPAHKIVIGTPLYAHQWVDGKPGPVILWHEAEALQNGVNSKYDPALGASWLEDNHRFVTWDSAKALGAKADLVRRLGLGGLMTWQITGDPEGKQMALMAQEAAD